MRAAPTVTQTSTGAGGSFAGATPAQTLVTVNGYVGYRTSASTGNGDWYETYTAECEL